MTLYPGTSTGAHFSTVSKINILTLTFLADSICHLMFSRHSRFLKQISLSSLKLSLETIIPRSIMRSLTYLCKLMTHWTYFWESLRSLLSRKLWMDRLWGKRTTVASRLLLILNSIDTLIISNPQEQAFGKTAADDLMIF